MNWEGVSMLKVNSFDHAASGKLVLALLDLNGSKCK
jgi:hypothetical protein